jgi:hypothetical protein
VACGEALTFPSFQDAGSLESARQQLRDALNRAAEEAQSKRRRPDTKSA